MMIKRLKYTAVLLLFFLALLAQPKAEAEVPFEQQLQQQEKQLKQLAAEIDSLRKASILVRESEALLKEPKQILWKLGLPVVAFVFLMWLAWKFVVWLEPAAFTKFIQRLVERYEEVNVLKRQKKILVISPPLKEEDTKSAFIQDLFEEKEFKLVEFQYDVTQYTAPEQAPDLIFVDNERGGLSQDLMVAYLKQFPGACLFYFGRPGSFDFKHHPAINDRINLANSRAQVYGNLLSTLKYHTLTQPRIRS